MRGDETRVVEAFCGYMRDEGWDITTEVAFCDVVASKPSGHRVYAEAKGRTAAPGLDVDTMFGQLLRRMASDDPAIRYAVVVPEGAALTAALRVPAWVRDKLRIDVYGVSETGDVWTQPGPAPRVPPTRT